jgi:hypothetical protein
LGEAQTTVDGLASNGVCVKYMRASASELLEPIEANIFSSRSSVDSDPLEPPLVPAADGPGGCRIGGSWGNLRLGMGGERASQEEKAFIILESRWICQVSGDLAGCESNPKKLGGGSG